MRRIYIAGPISRGNVEENVKKCIRAGLKLLSLGYAVYIPHFSYYAEPDAMEGSNRYEEWMQNDFAWIEVSNALLRVEGESAGADREVQAALTKGLPVYYDLDELVKKFPPGTHKKLVCRNCSAGKPYPHDPDFE